VLHQCDLGIYLLHVTERIRRVQVDELEIAFSVAESRFLSHFSGMKAQVEISQRTEKELREGLTGWILRSVILKKSPPRNECFVKLYKDYKRAMSDPSSKEAD
jgi:hypothetical protein